MDRDIVSSVLFILIGRAFLASGPPAYMSIFSQWASSLHVLSFQCCQAILKMEIRARLL